MRRIGDHIALFFALFFIILHLVLSSCIKNAGERDIAAGARFKASRRHVEASACFKEALRRAPLDVDALRLAASNARSWLGLGLGLGYGQGWRSRLCILWGLAWRSCIVPSFLCQHIIQSMFSSLQWSEHFLSEPLVADWRAQFVSRMLRARCFASRIEPLE